jgi:hypothetical protein
MSWQVPSDGTARRRRLPLLALIICVLSAVTLAVLSVILGCRNKTLLHRMDEIKALQVLPIADDISLWLFTIYVM